MFAYITKQSFRLILQGRWGKSSKTFPPSALVEGKETSPTCPEATPTLQSAHHLEDKNISLGWTFNKVIKPLSRSKTSSRQVLFAANHSHWQPISSVTPPGDLGFLSLNPNTDPNPNPKQTKCTGLSQPHTSTPWLILTLPPLCRQDLLLPWRSWESKPHHVQAELHISIAPW